MIAWIFPGQGSQFAGMGAGLSSEFARDTFAIARDVLGWDVRWACVEGPATSLGRTEVSQPAILTVSVAVAETLKASGALPDVIAGHSVGEFAALVVAQAVSFEDALRAVAVRGDAMARAGKQRPGSMTAILGLTLERVERVCEEAAGEVQVASINAPTQIVVSGQRDAVAAAAERARAAGARRVVPLDVSVAAHSSLMRPAADELRRALQRVSIRKPVTPFVSCVTGAREEDPDQITELLCRALTAPVRWVDAVRAIGADGTHRFIEVGPGRVLCGLVRSILPDPEVTPIGDDESIRDLAGALTGGRAT